MKTSALLTDAATGRSNTALRWVFFGQFHIAALAAVMMYCSGKLTGSVVDSHVVVFGSLGAWAVYLMDRLFPTRADALNQPQRSTWFTRNRALVITWLLVAGCIGLLLFTALPSTPRVVASLLLAAGCAYVLLPAVLRRFAAVKPLIIAGVWSVGIVILPLTYVGVNTGVIAALTVYRFAYLLPNCLLSDCNDVKGDRVMLHRTVPMILGERKVIYPIVASVVLAALSASILVELGLPWRLMLLDLVGMVFFLKAALGLRAGQRKRTIVLDVALFWPVVVLFAG